MDERKWQLQYFWAKQMVTDSLALCITGSVARNEATSYSDLDILIIASDSPDAELRVPSILQGLHAEFSQVSIVVRTVEDCATIRKKDFRSWLSLLDAVFVAGDARLFELLWDGLRNECLLYYDDIYEKLKQLTTERHVQYGSSTALLEPNVKNSAGALRDIHTICYLEKMTSMMKGTCEIQRSTDAAYIIEHSSLLPFRREALIEAWFFLLYARRRMHEIKGHLHDTLEFDCQPAVADEDSKESATIRRTVEAFMKQYYCHSRTIHLSLELSFFDHASESAVGKEDINKSFIHVPESGLNTSEGVLSVFLRSARENTRLGSDVIRAMTVASGFDYTSKECASLFDALLREKGNVGTTLRTMHECGILKRIFPEFEEVEYFFQHNVYHYYTVDEHTIKAIEAAEQLQRDQSLFGDVYRRLSDTSLLYYAILMHDIAKPTDIAGHEVLGAQMVPEMLRRYNREDGIDTVTFLVQHHLQMEQTAFRRDLRDPATIRSFSVIAIGPEYLELLLVLTIADMSALNPGVLTEWKKVLLIELFHAARNHREGNLGRRTPSASVADSYAMEGITDAEFNRAMEDVREGEPVRMFVFQRRAFTEIVIFCLDRHLLLSRLAAALLGADMAVVDASIDTRLDVAIDMFRVTDIVRNGRLDEFQIHRLRDLVRNVCTAEVEADEIFQRFRRKWVRKIKKTVRESVRTEVCFPIPERGAPEDRTIVEVYAPDAYGLLYILCREISAFGLDISFAKIATRVDGVVDSFYVREAQGLPFKDASRRELLRTTLLRYISELSQVE